MELLEPPYNYNVFRGDLEGFVRAVTDAISHPIQRYTLAEQKPRNFWLIRLTYSYVLEEMRLSSVEKRLVNILEKDWKREAELRTSQFASIHGHTDTGGFGQRK